MFKVDRLTATCIVGWVVPLVSELARSQADVESSSDALTSDTPTKMAAFHFTASPTPNVRGKVTWNPSAHMWALQVGKPKGQAALSQVDPSLDADQYEREKVAAYSRAIQAWNRIDGTTRHRIPEPW